MTDLKNMDGEPCEVGLAAVNKAIETHRAYEAALNEALPFIRSAHMTETLTESEDADPSEAWNESWEARVMAYLTNRSQNHRAILLRLRGLVDSYEGYDE